MNGRIKRPDAGGAMKLPRIGTIKCGMKAISRNGKEYPTSVDYFIPSGKYASLFTQAYGDKPDTIQVVFLSDDPAVSCNERYEYRDDTGALVAYGDGETFGVYNAEKNLYVECTMTDHPNLMEIVRKKYPSRKGWEITMTLQFMLPAVRGVAGIWQFITKGSASTIPQIRDIFDAILESKGYVKGIIFDLTVTMHKSNKPGSTSRYPVVSLVPNESEENKARIKGENLLLHQ